MSTNGKGGKPAGSTHVVPHEGDWAVKRGGRTLSTHKAKKAATDAGRESSRRAGTEFVVHNKDGRISSKKDSHGNDPRRIRG